MDISAMDHTPVMPLGLQGYLVQWLKTATGANVSLAYNWTAVGKCFLHFRCQRCGDNLNQEVKTFAAGTDFAIPSEVQDWVGYHLHPEWQTYKITYGQTNTTLTQPLPQVKPLDSPKGRKFRD